MVHRIVNKLASVKDLNQFIQIVTIINMEWDVFSNFWNNFFNDTTLIKEKTSINSISLNYGM